MIKILIPFLATLSVGFTRAEEMIPSTPGVSWQYNMTQEAGEGVRLSDLKADPDGKYRASVIYRVNGTKDIDGKKLLEFEMHRAGRVTNTDLITVNEHGIICSARIDPDGVLTKLEPPQIMVAAPLKTNGEWDFDSNVSGSKVHQHYRVMGEEEIDVPAGKFRAFRIHGEQTSPNAMTIDRWFASGIGIVKDVTTMESEDGDLIRRISLELKALPRTLARPEVKPTAPPQKLTVSLAKQPVGEGTANFTSATPKIYARWQGHALPDRAKVRVVWIAEEVSEIPPDYTVDQATTTATAPDSHGIFTLSRPDNGWTPGVYRVEFYIDEVFVDALKLKIAKVSDGAF